MKVLVTGAGGFVGSNLVRALHTRGDEVHACIRKSSDTWRLADIIDRLIVHDVDMTNESSIEEAVTRSKPEVVYHLVHYGGNPGQTDSDAVRRIIVDGTRSLYDACKRAGVPAIVNAGSSSEYGPQTEAMRENMEPTPNTDYGIAKLEATMLGEEMRRSEKMHITTLRLFSVYGQYEAPTRFFPAVILALMKGVPPSLSDPKTVRDFVHVDDVTAAFMLAPGKPAGVYNVGTGIQSTLGEAAQEIKAALNSEVVLQWGAPGRSFDGHSWRADTTYAQRELGWAARISLFDGVERTVEWFRQHHHLYER